MLSSLNWAVHTCCSLNSLISQITRAAPPRAGMEMSCTELMWNHSQSFVFLRLQIQQLPARPENSMEHNQHWDP